MQTITTNTDALQKRINSEVEKAFTKCKIAADEGRTFIYFKTDRDIQRDVRDILEKCHNICVPTICSPNAMSRANVEHFQSVSEMKLVW
jgi:hypothetical protein